MSCCSRIKITIQIKLVLHSSLSQNSGQMWKKMKEDKDRIPHAADCCYQAAVYGNEQRNHVLKWKQHADKKEPNQFQEHLCACIITITK